MSHQLIDKVNAKQMRKDNPDFRIGDTVDVAVRIVEGDKERTQVFTGVVMSKRGSGMSEMFTVRRIVNNEGVERTFPLHSPKVSGISVTRGGKVRRAKLYYLRDRVGKSTRLKDIERNVTAPAGQEAAQTAKPAAAEQASQEAPKA